MADPLQEDTSPGGPVGAGDARAHPTATVDLSATHGGQYKAARSSLGAWSTPGIRSIVGRAATVVDDVAIGSDVFVARSVSVANDVTVGDGSDIGYASTIGDAAQLGQGVVTVGPGVLVGDNAVFARGVTVLADSVGTGTIIGPDADIGTGVTLGDRVRIRKATTIGAGATIASGARIGGGVDIGDRTTIGVTARIRAGAIIDPGAVVSDGAYVRREERIDVVSIAGPLYSLDVGPGIPLDLVGMAPGASSQMPSTFTMGCVPGPVRLRRLPFMYGCRMGVRVTRWRRHPVNRHQRPHRDGEVVASAHARRTEACWGNGYGLYEMSGNVCEFVADYMEFGALHSPESVTDPLGTSGPVRTARGGTGNAAFERCVRCIDSLGHQAAAASSSASACAGRPASLDLARRSLTPRPSNASLRNPDGPSVASSHGMLSSQSSQSALRAGYRTTIVPIPPTPPRPPFDRS